MEPLTPNLLEPSTNSLLSPALEPNLNTQNLEEDFREFGDVDKTRQNIYNRVLQAAQSIEPVSNQRHTLRLSNVDYQDPDIFSKKDQKLAILSGLSQGRRVKGTWELVDNETGNARYKT